MFHLSRTVAFGLIAVKGFVMAQENTRQMTISRVFDAPVAEVWKAWSDPDRVREWWGPTGFTSPLAKMDFREGGISLVCMRAPQEMGGHAYPGRTWSRG